MKKHLGNFSLMILLIALLVAPLAGFKLVKYVQEDSAQVLSVQSERKEIVRKDKDEDDEPVFLHPSNIIRFFR